MESATSPRRPDTGLPLTPHSAVRDGDYKLLFNWHGKLELYNIRKDRYEQHDLAATMPDRTQAMFAQLSTWIDENIADRYLPTKNKNYDAAKDKRPFPFYDLRHELLGHAPLQ